MLLNKVGLSSARREANERHAKEPLAIVSPVFAPEECNVYRTDEMHLTRSVGVPAVDWTRSDFCSQASFWSTPPRRTLHSSGARNQVVDRVL